MELHVGTSGFSFDSWHGSFYPKDLPAKDRLAHYATQLGHLIERNRAEYALVVAKEQFSKHGVPVETVLLHGDPAASILDFSETQPGVFVAMTTHGESGVSRWLLGSVAEKVVRGADCPTLVVHGDQDDIPARADELRALKADVVVDVIPFTPAHARGRLAAFDRYNFFRRVGPLGHDGAGQVTDDADLLVRAG